MAYGEKLQLIDMLAAMEMGNQNNARRQQQENEMRQMQMQRQWQKEDQLKRDLALSNASMVVPGGFASAALPRMGEQVLLRDTPGYITGTPPETVFKEKMATGRAAMGAMSGGGGYGRGRGGGGQGQPTNPYPDGVRGTGPDSAQAAAALGEIYRPGGQEPTQAPMSIAELLADERGNVAGGQSLIDQRNTMGGTPVASPTWETPVQNTINQENATAQEQWKAEELKNAMKTKPAEAKNRVAGRKNEATAVLNYEKQLLKDKRWLDRENPIPEEIKKEMRPLWRAFAMSAYRKGVAPDIESFFKNFETE